MEDTFRNLHFRACPLQVLQIPLGDLWILPSRGWDPKLKIAPLLPSLLPSQSGSRDF